MSALNDGHRTGTPHAGTGAGPIGFAVGNPIKVVGRRHPAAALRRARLPGDPGAAHPRRRPDDHHGLHRLDRHGPRGGRAGDHRAAGGRAQERPQPLQDAGDGHPGLRRDRAGVHRRHRPRRRLRRGERRAPRGERLPRRRRRADHHPRRGRGRLAGGVDAADRGRPGLQPAGPRRPGGGADQALLRAGRRRVGGPRVRRPRARGPHRVRPRPPRPARGDGGGPRPRALGREHERLRRRPLRGPLRRAGPHGRPLRRARAGGEHGRRFRRGGRRRSASGTSPRSRWAT